MYQHRLRCTVILNDPGSTNSMDTSIQRINLHWVCQSYSGGGSMQLGTRYGALWLVTMYLSIMATSVSSERAFSSSAITISKRHSHLTGDVVEALQCLKCFIQQDLLFRELENPSVLSEYGNEEDLLSSQEDEDLEKPDDLDDSDIVMSMLSFE